MPKKPSAVDRYCWRLGILDPASPLRVNVPVIATIAAFHALALLACVPWLFSWSGLAWCALGPYVFGTLGINVCYHRLLTHRGFACPRWLEHGLSVLGVCCWQGTPVNWVAVHRMHHQNSDVTADPHSPRKSFFWSHMGWFMVIDPAIYNLGTFDRYARDLIHDRFYKWLEHRGVYRKIQWCQWGAFLAAGALAGWLTTWTPSGALQLGLSWLVWGVILRTVIVWHITWSVNSLGHVWGYQTFDTADDSRNNWLVGLISNGEGWHNNHHADPRCAAHGLRWWEFDVSYLTICALAWLGLIRDVMPPRHKDPQAPGSPPASTPAKETAAA
jgi:stearoyl-CoA desaturase (delta-9 desaturase)